MVDYLVSQYELNLFLQQLEGLCVTQFSEDCSKHINVGIGILFNLSNFAEGPDGVYEEKRTVSQFLLSVGSSIMVRNIVGVEYKVSCDNLLLMQKAQSEIIGRRISSVSLKDDNTVQFLLDSGTVSLTTSSEWNLSQPGTEEDQMTISKNSRVKKVRLRRRWSHSHAKCRDKWHSI